MAAAHSCSPCFCPDPYPDTTARQPRPTHFPTQVFLYHLYEAKPCEVSQVLWGYARLCVPGVPGKVFLDAVCRSVASNMHAYGPQELANVMWALVSVCVCVCVCVCDCVCVESDAHTVFCGACPTSTTLSLVCLLCSP